MRNAFVIAAALTASACASSSTTDSSSARYAALSESCSQRGGVLGPSMDRRLTGKPGTGYVCRISGSGSRIPPQVHTLSR